MKKSATVNLLAVRKCRWRSSRIPSMLSAQASVDTRATYLKYKIVIKWHSFLEYMYNCAHIIKNNGISTMTPYKMQCRNGTLFLKLSGPTHTVLKYQNYNDPNKMAKWHFQISAENQIGHF